MTDSDRQPLPGARVELCGPALERVLPKITDARGACRFEELNPGLYQIEVTLIGYKTTIRKNIRITTTEAQILRVGMEMTGLREDFVEYLPKPVDPTITAFTAQDAVLLRRASSTLRASLASSRERLAETAGVCDRRALLLDSLRNWEDILEKTKQKLLAPPQSHEKRSMIEAVFTGMRKHLQSDLNSIRELDRNTRRIHTHLNEIANLLDHAADTGRATFDLQIVSIPEDVEISYRSTHQGPEKRHPERTPTTLKDMDYASYLIIFKQEGRSSSASITYNPYNFPEAGLHRVRMNLLTKKQAESGYQRPPSLAERVRESDLIIVGCVQNMECRWNETKSDIYTYVNIAVERSIKGVKTQAGNLVVIKKLGGSLQTEGIIQYVERLPAGLSAPGFLKNEKALLMLKAFPDSKHYRVVSGRHGKFTLTNDDILERGSMPLMEFIKKIKESIERESMSSASAPRLLDRVTAFPSLKLLDRVGRRGGDKDRR